MAHDRTLDHYGTEDDTTMVLGSTIGPYPEGMVLHDVLVDLARRIAFIEATGCGTLIFPFTADAWIRKDYTFTADCVISSFAGSFTTDSWIQPAFTADAIIIENVEC